MTEAEPDEDVEDDERPADAVDEADGSAADRPDADADAAGPEVELGVDDELVDRIDSADPEDIAKEIADLQTEIDGLEAERDDLKSKLKRKQADFENYKKRMEERRDRERERATADLVERLLEVRDNLLRALDQEEGTDIRGGVETTLSVFDDVLDEEGVTPVEPAPGEEVDPHRQEVLVRVESDQPEGTVADLHRPGYEMGDTVLREAQVTVSEGSAGDHSGDAQSPDDDAAPGPDGGEADGADDPAWEGIAETDEE